MRALTHAYRRRTLRGAPSATEALRGVDLLVPAGQQVAMLGPNGSGKSTLMNLICGLLPLQRGSIEVFGSARPAEARRNLGVVFQTDSLDRMMSVRENLRDQAILYGLRGSQATAAAQRELDAAGLLDRLHDPVGSLSRGLARRVDLCRALLHKPCLLLLDEPTVGLDPAAREHFLAELGRRRASHELTVLMSTHLIDEAERADRVVLMHQGRIIADDSPANLRKQIGARQVTVPDAGWTPPPADGVKWRRTNTGWAALLGDDQREAEALATRLAREAVPFSMAPPSLADVFEQLTGSRLHVPTPMDDPP